MRHAGIFSIALIAIAAVIASDYADAKRMGGGKSLGTQRQSVAPSNTAPPASAPSVAPSGAASQPVMPAQAGAAAAAKTAAPAAAAAKTGLSRWMGPIAGLAAGLGLAALLSHFGLSEGFASMLLIGLLVVGVVLVVRMFLARRTPMKPSMQYAGPSGLDTKPGGYETQPAPALGGSSRLEPVITDASAPTAAFSRPLPSDFDAAAFVEQAKLQFTRLQDAFDRGDRKLMADVMTPAMLIEIERDLDTRGEHRPTAIVELQAAVLEVKTEGRDHWVSVRFTGMLREDDSLLPTAVDEIWNLTKPVVGRSGWLLAGIEQVQSA